MGRFIGEGSMPSGGIIMWSGSTASIPAGWYLCDGANGTPDLRNRFVVGAGSSYGVGATGGSANAVVVSHNHSAGSSAAGSHYHRGANAIRSSNGSERQAYARQGWEGSTSGYSPAYQSSVAQAYSVTSDAGSHSHSVSVYYEGESGTNKNLPPYYALAFIMKS